MGFISLDGNVYKDFTWNLNEDGVMESKLYTFWDNIMYKKFARFDITWEIQPDAWESKSLTVEIWIDWEKVDERTYTKTEKTQIKEKIDLYDIGQSFQFKIKHSGVWRVEVHDVQIFYKGTTIQPQDYN